MTEAPNTRPVSLVDRVWEALKERCCADPVQAKRCVMVSRDDLAAALQQPPEGAELIERVARAIRDEDAKYHATVVAVEEYHSSARAAIAALQSADRLSKGEEPTCTVCRTPGGILWLYSGNEWRSALTASHAPNCPEDKPT